MTASKDTIVKGKTQVSDLHPKYRPDIDGLRAVAVLLVVVFHAFPRWAPGGFIGVDIFFVISGFLISSIIFGSLERESFSIVNFYQRRIRRIFPALLIVMAVSLLAGWLTFFPDEYAQLVAHIAAGAGFVSNFLLYGERGYFDNSSATKPMLHLWSLAIEEQFYIFWPLLLAFVWKRKWSFLRITAAIGILSFAVNVYLITRHPIAAYYWPVSRFWELMIGGILAYVTLHRPGMIRRHKNLQSIAGATLIFAGAVSINDTMAFPGWWALLPTVGSFLIVSAGPDGWLNKYILANKAFVGIGLISYPLYLWHWPLLSFIKIVGGDALLRRPMIRIFAVLAALALSWLTWQLVEKPIRHNGGYRAAFALAAAMVVMAITSIGIAHAHGLEDRSALRTSTFTDAVRQQFSGPIWQYASNEACLRRFPFDESRQSMWWFCMLEKDEPPTFILIGNSYANELYPGLSEEPELARQNFLSIGTCDPGDAVPVLNVEKDNPCYGDRAARQEQFIDNLIAANGTIRYAVLDGLARKSRHSIYRPHQAENRLSRIERHSGLCFLSSSGAGFRYTRVF